MPRESTALLARRNVGMDMQYSVYMAGRSDPSRGEEPGLTLRGFFLTFHECDCWKLARETRRCPIEGDNVTEHFWIFSLNFNRFGYYP